MHNGSGKMVHEAGSQYLECADLTLAVETLAVETQNSKFSWVTTARVLALHHSDTHIYRY